MRLFYPQEEEKTKKEVLGWMRQTTLTGEVAPQDPRGRGIPQGCGHFVNSPHSFTLPTNFLFRRLAKEGRNIGDSERKMLENYSTLHGIRYFVNRSWVSPCCQQMLAIGAQAMYIACSDTSDSDKFSKIKDPRYNRYVLYL